MRTLARIPMFGGLLLIVRTYFGIFHRFLKSPINYIPAIGLSSDATVGTALRTWVAGLAMAYFFLLPTLGASNVMLAQLMLLLFMTAQYLAAMPLLHLSFKLFGSTLALGRFMTFAMICFGLFMPISVLLQYPTFMIAGGESFLYGHTGQAEIQLRLKEFYSSSEHALLFGVLSSIGMMAIFMLAALQVLWLCRFYSLGWWRSVGGVVLGVMLIVLLETMVLGRLWDYLGVAVVSIASTG